MPASLVPSTKYQTASPPPPHQPPPPARVSSPLRILLARHPNSPRRSARLAARDQPEMFPFSNHSRVPSYLERAKRIPAARLPSLPALPDKPPTAPASPPSQLSHPAGPKYLPSPTVHSLPQHTSH